MKTKRSVEVEPRVDASPWAHQNARMSRARRAAALLSLAALLTPFGSGAVIGLHLATSHTSHHHDADDDAVGDLRAVWHGHSHGKATPDHDHPGIAPQVLVSRASAAGLKAPSPLLLIDYVARRVCAEQRFARSFAAGRTGVGPPFSSERQAILRV